ncbi:right-handed parallel beta-helix repeat-containing protein [Candidatus Desantisbacteria bacterium]|nr:right-handed parallel beta-helix repeat-containing protein [Candidatus Desantisbacteria bacterium]
MTCNTCHNPHRWTPGLDKGGPGKKTEGDGKNSFLRLDNRKVSALCVDCHQREGLCINTDHDLSVTIPDEENIAKETVGMSGACSACHIMHNAEDIRRWAKPLGPGDDYITQLCHSCHFEGKCAESKIGAYSHPVGVPMQKGRTTTLPLYTKDGKKQKNGLITCVTCHYSHQWSPAQYQKNVLSKGLFSFENIRSKVIGNVGYTAGAFVYIDTIDSFKPEVGQQYVIFKNGKIIARCAVDKINPFSRTMEVFAKIIEYDPEEKIEKGNYAVEKSKLSKGLEGTGRTSFLRRLNDASTSLCFDCHSEKETIIGTDHDFRITAPQEKNMVGETVYDGGLCSACHRSHQGASIYISAKLIPPDPKGIIYSPLCFGCHTPGGVADEKKLSVHHKIIPYSSDEELAAFAAKTGILKETMKTQPPDKKFGLILYGEDGEIDKGDNVKKKVVTCSSCHNEHTWDPMNPTDKHPWDSAANTYVKKVEGDARNSFLRVRNESYQLCNACHLATVHLEQEEILKRLGKDKKSIEDVSKALEEKKKMEILEENKRKKFYEEQEMIESKGKVGNIKSISKDSETGEYLAFIKLFGGIVLNNKEPGKYMISLNENFEDAKWKDYRQEISFPVSLKTNITKLYLKFQDKMGNISLPQSINIPPIILSLKTVENKSKLPNLCIEAEVIRAIDMRIGEDKYLENSIWKKYETTIIFTFPKESPMDRLFIQFKDAYGNKTEIAGIYTPEDLIKPRIKKYIYPEPIKITDNFFISLVFSETLNQNIIPKIKITNQDGGKSPSVYEGGIFTSTYGESDTYTVENIKLTKEMGGKLLISVQGAEGVIRNVMEPISDYIIFFDTRDKILDFYNSVNFKVKEGDRVDIPIATLLMEGKGAHQMMISENDPGFENSIWEPFVKEKSYMLTPMAGEKTIYVKFRNDEKLVSDIFNRTIIYLKSSEETDMLSGSLIKDRILTKDGSPYYVSGEFTVERGVTLTIEPGVKLLFSDYIRGDVLVSKGLLRIKGNIIAKGTQENNIIFTSKKDSPVPGDWECIIIDRNITEKKNIFEYCYFSFSNNGLMVEADNPVISNSIFENIKNNAINYERDCQGEIHDCVIKNISGSGIFLKECSPSIYKNTFENNKTGILCMHASQPKIIDNYFNNNETGISCEEMATPKIVNAVIENNKIGIKIVAYSFPTITQSNVVDNKNFGIFISESSPMIYYNIIQKNKIGIFIEKDYRDFAITYNNIMDNEEYNLKIWDYWRDLQIKDNYWGSDLKSIIKRKIYDKENYDLEAAAKESKKNEEDEMPVFEFFSTEDAVLEKMKKESEKSGKLDFISKSYGVVRYTPYSLFKFKNAGVQ